MVGAWTQCRYTGSKAAGPCLSLPAHVDEVAAEKLVVYGVAELSGKAEER